METKYIAAAVQASPTIMDKQATIDKAVALIEEAAQQKARLICFPECFVSAYPNWSIDLQIPTEWPNLFADFVESSIEIPGPEVEQLAKAAKKANAYVAIGVNEQSGLYPGRLFNTILFLSPAGEIIGIHRKIFPTNREKLFHTMGDGSTMNVFQTEIGRLGGLICYEHLQPLLKYTMFSKGEQVHYASWPGWPDFKAQGGRSNRHVVDIASRAYALEGQVFVVCSSMYVPEEQIPQHIQNASWSYFGGSCIIAPDGEYVTEPVYGQETIVYGEIDLRKILVRKAAVDTTGKDSRWDMVNLRLREEPDVALNGGQFTSPRPDKILPYGTGPINQENEEGEEE
ncbi:putative amidohydrolase [Caldalkalibacillus uzonensis]|uniref:Amidohydrolase n=1 Tax=Caldalkalibacillus uzonensis TaxID=353224 RepID=A0ABU0CU41_9BACI|nr:carbon-nitrogen hydrolase family protein [Caldalkalibacillus uzonensis]MDQ0339939.1 putative amidohydrolase [Caldalkalibacillus uzonensis]